MDAPFDYAQAAAVLFGNPDTQPQPSTAEAIPASSDAALAGTGGDASAPVRTPEEAATALYGEKAPTVEIDMPEAVKKLREGDSALFDKREAYSTAITIDDFKTVHDEDGNVVEVPEHVQVAVAQEYRAIAADIGAAPVEVSEFVTIVKQTTADDLTPEAADRGRTEISRLLLDMNSGDRAAAQADLDLVRALIRRDPRVAQIVGNSKAGNSVRAAGILLQRARAERVAGRL